MSQNNIDRSQAAETPTRETRTFIQQVRSATRRKYAPEDKTRIVQEGFRREVTVSDRCQREGIKPGVFYAWTKEFMEAGKERLTRDTVSDVAHQEIERLRRENHDLKQLVADLSLEVHRFKQRPSRLWTRAPAHERPKKLPRSYPMPGSRPSLGESWPDILGRRCGSAPRHPVFEGSIPEGWRGLLTSQLTTSKIQVGNAS